MQKQKSPFFFFNLRIAPIILCTIYLLCSAFPNSLSAQNSYLTFSNDTNVIDPSMGTLKMPWAGGINASQVSMMDLNGDATEDLVLFERTMNKTTTFLGRKVSGKTSFVPAPYYERFFPKMQGWMLLRDYNCDGKKDIFTHGNTGMRLFKNVGTIGAPKFKLIAQPLFAKIGGSNLNLFVNYGDIPTIHDIDQDGDLDILSYAFFSGEQVEFYRNLSIEQRGKCDTLILEMYTGCWGKFTQNVLCQGSISKNQTCSGSGGIIDKRLAHIGSSSVAFDFDGNGTQDILAGDVSCSSLNLLRNKSTIPLMAEIDSVITPYPKTDPAFLYNFPAAFVEDIDQDGKKDLIAGVNLDENEDLRTDFQHSLWYYKNLQTGGGMLPQLQTKALLQEDMIDVGEGASPTLYDVDQDGDMDLLLGTRGIPKNGDFVATLILYENIGNAANPKFRKANNNYAGLAKRKWQNIKPAFVDLQKDGKVELTILYTDSNAQTSLAYIPNLGTIGFTPDTNQAVSILSSLGSGDAPTWLDYDGDGIKDLFLGKSSGGLYYYRNTSSSSIILTLINNLMGGIPNNNALKQNLHTAPFKRDSLGQEGLLTVSNEGLISHYSQFRTSASNFGTRDTSLFWNTLLAKKDGHNLGKNLFLAVADLNADGFDDILVGNNNGGVYYLKHLKDTQLSLVQTPTVSLKHLSIAPNPCQDQINLLSTQKGILRMIDAQGKICLERNIAANESSTLSMTERASGFYMIQFQNALGLEYYKLIKE